MDSIKSNLNKWFLKPNILGNQTLRIICIPYAGGSAAIYKSWEKLAGKDVQLYALQLPGRGGRYEEKPYTQMDNLVIDLFNEIRELFQEDTPYIIFGHSMGALIGYELVRVIRKNGLNMPKHFIVSAAAAPSTPRNGKTHKLSTQDLQNVLQDYNGTPNEILENLEMLEMFLPSIRADFELVEEYCYTQDCPLNCPITALWGTKDHLVNIREIEKWKYHTDKKFQIKQFEGDHFFIHNYTPDIVDLVKGLSY
ncbi:thioesterase II family protein [Shouchella patagoniensis]|uniref:thioesterase II family protein n=1 Tax=Shouchella patagoniensis TaxID=228576 RepID=UPI00099513E6|nr:alpha/beta fold hydrolase [Shouchella patagoniensis]